VLSAQTHAVPFYARLGFATEGEVYDDCGIPHIDMRRAL
jgi:predicted GNAT family N-acyltransferase